jgi:hypothetical protein
MIALLLTLAASLVPPPTADLGTTSEPIEVSAPRSIVAGWDSFATLPPPAKGTIAIRTADAVPPGAGRIDILRREGKRWSWLATSQYAPDLALPPADFDRGVLLRFDGSPTYFWNEVPASVAGLIVLRRLKNLSVEATPPGAMLVLYIPSERAPRTLAAGPFRLVPVETTLACVASGNDSRCAEVGASITRVSLPLSAGDDVRVLRIEPQAEDAFNVLARGNVAMRPKKVGGMVAQAFPWVAIALHEKGLSWNDVLVDRSGRELALQRLHGSLLPSLPAFGDIASRRERGLVIRPFVGERRDVLVDPSALLLVFPGQGSDLASAVPLVTAAPSAGGAFVLPTLGTGTYALKLVSSDTSAERTTVSAMVGVPLDVVFPSGPTVRGRVARASGGSSTDQIAIELLVDAPFMEAIKSGDLMDRMRVTTADGNGNFHMVIAIPGRYRIRARWGSSTAERAFEIESSTRDLDLGDILLKPGTTLHGELPVCHDGGEAIAIAVPDLSKPPNFEPLRAPIAADGRFLIDGLVPGRWSVLLRCAGKPIKATPEVVTVPESGELVIRFTQAEPSEH